MQPLSYRVEARTATDLSMYGVLQQTVLLAALPGVIAKRHCAQSFWMPGRLLVAHVRFPEALTFWWDERNLDVVRRQQYVSQHDFL